MVAKRLTVLEKIARAVSRTSELDYMQTLPQFEGMSHDQIRETTQEVLAEQESNRASRVDRTFLNYVFKETGTENPWRASAKHELVDVVLRRSEKEIAQGGRVAARGAGDRPLIRQHFGFFNPETGSNFHSGIDRAYKFRSAFGTPHQQTIIRQVQSQPEALREQLDAAALEYLGSIQTLLDAAKKDPDIKKRINSIDTKGEIYLVREAEAMLKELAQIELEVRVESISEAMVRIGLEPRRFLVERQGRSDVFEYWDDQISSGTKLDQFAYGILRSADGDYPEEIKQLAFGLLYGKYAQNKYVNANVVVKAEKDDLEFLRELDDEHELIQATGRPQVTGLDDILNRHDINLVEAARIYEADDFILRRQVAWEQYLNQEQLEEMTQTARTFQEIFEGEEGAIYKSVPRDISDNHDFSSVITRNEWRTMLDWQVLSRTHDGLAKMIRRTGIKEARMRADEVLATGRKVQYLNNVLENHEVDQVAELPKHVQAELAGLRKGTYQPIERFDGDMPGLVDRLKHLHRKVGAWDLWRNHGARMETLAEAWLFDPSINIERFQKKLMSYTATDEMEETALAQEVIAHPAVRARPAHMEPDIIPTYASRQQVERIKDIAGTKVSVQATEDDWRAYDSALRTKFIDGSLEGSLTLASRGAQWEGVVEQKTWGAILDGEAFRAERATYSPVTEQFLHQIKYLSQRSSSGVLAELGLETSDSMTWSLANRQGIGPHAEAKTSLIEAVDEVYQQVQEMQPVRINFHFEGPDRKFNGYNRRQGRKFSFDSRSAMWSIDVPKDKVDATIQDIYKHSSAEPEVHTEDVEL